MTKLRISSSLATKLIGTFGLTISILMINILASHFLLTTERDKFSATVESWALFGLNWALIVKYSQNYKQAEFLLICVLLYAGCSVVANALLCLASISKKPQLALPWLYIQVINIIDLSIAIAVHLFGTDFNTYERSVWYMPLSSVYLLLSTYFLTVVCTAKNEWVNSPPHYNDICISTITRSYNTQGSNLQKSPSYLADQSSFIVSSKPVMSSNYEQV